MAHGLSKSKIINWRQCPRRLWLQTYRPDLAVTSSSSEQVLRAGHEVGAVAQALHPGGLLVETETLGAAIKLTRELLVQHPDRPLFEATFARDGVLVRADLMLPERGGYRVVEVKSAGEVKDYYLEDAAIQHWVMSDAVPIKNIEIAHVDTGFIYSGGGNYEGLFRHVSVDEPIEALLTDVPKWVAGARETLDGANEPVCEPGSQCREPYECPFEGHCTAGRPIIDYPLSCLPNLHWNKRDALLAQGVQDVRDVPADFPLTDNQARSLRVIRNGVPELTSEAAAELATLPYPRYYMDFETIKMAVPIWAGTRPYQMIPVQWSCHVEVASGALEHRAYLADGVGDPRQEFAERLIEAIGNDGPVFVYNQAFELGRLSELARDFPALAAQIEAIMNRVVDLLPMTRKSYCHPDMKGSWSIKSVLPTIDKTLDYATMAVPDGGAAESAWLEIFHPDTPADRKEQLRQDLGDYCALDTLAMVRLARFLSSSAGTIS